MGARILAAVLAGGGSRRFGADKAMADFDGAPLIVRVGERLRAQADAIAVCGHEQGAALLGCALLPDPEAPVCGPLLGVFAAMSWALGEGGAWLVTAPCDTPFIPLNMAERLVTAARAAHAQAAFAQTPSGLHPLCAAWSPQLATALGAQFAAGAHPQVRAAAPDAPCVMFEDEDAFANINTLEDFERLRPRR
ncbi:MAG: molybdenum cofactor guanylyltransferase [Hyphomonadaceae bacterium]